MKLVPKKVKTKPKKQSQDARIVVDRAIYKDLQLFAIEKDLSIREAVNILVIQSLERERKKHEQRERRKQKKEIVSD